MKVSNRKPVRRLALRSLLANKRRNLIAIIAITLTAILFTTLFTILLSVKSSYETSRFRELGGCEHATFKDVTDEDIARLSTDGRIKEWGARTVIGVDSSPIYKKRSAEISYMDENTTKWSYIKLEEGHLPTAKNEVIMDSEALKLLGIEPKLGAEVKLSFNIMGEADESAIYTDTFVLAGYWDFDPVCPAHFVNVSKEYVDDFAKIAGDMGYGPFRTDMNIMFGSSADIDGKMAEIAVDAGYDLIDKTADNYIRYGVNPGYMTVDNSVDLTSMGTIVSIFAFSLLVGFTGYLIIYNVFQLSVSGDIRFYGLIKTIGVTPKQLKRIIRIQALFLCMIGIPVGLLAGYGLGAGLTGMVLKTSTIPLKSLTISASPIIFVAASAFEVVTVLLSTSKPGRLAAKVSPVEALRYTEGADISKKKKTTKGARVTEMAFANMGRNKKKTILVFVSLALALVVLNSVNLFVGGFDTEKWLESRTVKDFVVGSDGYFKFKGARSLYDENFVNDIAYIRENVNAVDEGKGYEADCYTRMVVDESTYNGFAENYPEYTDSLSRGENGEYLENAVVEGLDDVLIDKLVCYEGDVNLLKDPNGRYVAFMANMDEARNIYTDPDAPKVGEKVRIAYADGIEVIDTKTGGDYVDGVTDANDVEIVYTEIKECEYTVAAYVGVPYAISPRYGSLCCNVVISAKTLEGDVGEKMIPMFYSFDTPDNASEDAAEAFIKAFCEDSSSYQYESKAVSRQEFNDFKGMFLILGGVLCGIIGIVGVLNFFNAVMAGIIARKNELAVLQAIGMTGGQVKSMLVTEGLIYTVGAGVIAFALSLAFTPVLNGLMSNMFWFYSGHFSVTPVAIMIPVFAIIGFAVPFVAYKGLSKTPVVERIREIG